MRLLLDTNVMIWALYDPDELRPAARQTLERSGAPAYYSAASIWELAIKQAIGKLPHRAELMVRELDRLGFLELPVRACHAVAAGRLPQHHKDPFDRLIIAQALEEAMLLVSRDRELLRYDVPVLEA